MKRQRSLSAKLVVAFIAVAIPFLLFLVYINRYAMDVVRTQVAESQLSLLRMHANDMDGTLTQVDHYLLSSAFQHAGITSLMLNAPDSDEYTLTRIQVLNQLNRDLVHYNRVGMLFAYAALNEDLMTSEPNRNVPKAIREQLAETMRTLNAHDAYLQTWSAITFNGEPWLMRVEKNDFNVYTGALIRVATLMEPIRSVMAEGSAQVLLLNDSGELLSSGLADPPSTEERLRLLGGSDKPYETIAFDREEMLVVTNASQQSDTRLVVLIPESQLLKRLVTFQTIIKLAPLAAALLLLLLLFFLRGVVLKPTAQLVRGMRRIKDGDLTYRLEPSASKEFGLITDNFNAMASEIKDLKIHVYEEQLRLNKAEIKQLQLQIHPHFLLNSLNVVFHLVESRETKLAQRMIRYIMNYFRFVTRTSVPFVRLEEEIEHISTYLEIQKMRFPNFLDFEIAADGDLKDYLLPPVLFQPFVENAIIHGFRIRNQRFVIRISAERDPESPDGGLVIRIADNGTGFTEEQLEKFGSASFKQDHEHLGIGNVYDRLRMNYGERAKLLFDNLPDGGAEVALRLPLQTVAPTSG